VDSDKGFLDQLRSGTGHEACSGHFVASFWVPYIAEIAARGPAIAPFGPIQWHACCQSLCARISKPPKLTTSPRVAA
jgi:hypothetical protein